MCALLHDNALTQYISEELKKDSVIDLKKDLSEEKTNLHCIYGEKNITKLPFKTDVSNVILYHHEHADGTGPFQKKWNEIPLFARIIHLADIIDIIRNSIDSDDNSWDLWGTVTIGSKGQIVIPKAARETFEHEKQKQEDLGLHCEVTIDGYTDFIFINRFGQAQHQATLNKQSEELSVIAMMSSFCTVMNLMCYFLILAATRLDIHLQQECVKLE
jgi:bifunctional DNA-binding transcriptional regulator/antitoxin component of YhaV-PrlF toxin-antitoxin module